MQDTQTTAIEKRILHRNSSNEMIIRTMEENWRENRRSWAAVPAFTLRDDDTFFWFTSGLKPRWLNGIMQAKLNNKTIDRKINEAIQYFKIRQQDFNWIIGPTSTPENLPTRLNEFGFEKSGEIPGLALIIPRQQVSYRCPPGVTIQPVNSGRKFKDWKSVLFHHQEGDPPRRDITYKYQVASAFHPGKSQFVGYLENRPVSITSLLLSQGVAGIYSVITLPHARHNGMGTAMTQFAVQQAQAAGYAIVTLQASRSGLNLYQNIGFNIVYNFPVFTVI